MAGVEPALVGDLLVGDTALPWRTPRLRALAAVLPAAAERSRIPGTVEAGWPWVGLREVLWPEVLEHAVEREPGWEELAGALVACVEVLAGRVPGGDKRWPIQPRRRFGAEDESPPHLAWATEWRDVLEQVAPSLSRATDLRAVGGTEAGFKAHRRPQVHALLRGSPPCRILLTEPRPKRTHEPAGANEVRELLVRLGLGGADVGWWLRVRSEGRSAMAGLFLRALAESHPEALRALGDVGITGDLGPTGTLLPVAALREKVHTFFDHYPEGTCFVPWRQQHELDGLRPEGSDPVGMFTRKRDPSRLSPGQWSRVVPVASVQHLLALLGVCDGATPALEVLGHARARSGTVQDWRGRGRPVASLADVPMRRRADRSHEAWRFRSVSIRGLALAAWGDDDGVAQRRRLVVTGRPGSGKSMVMRQLHCALSAVGTWFRGPSLLLPARRLLDGASLVEAVAADLDVPGAAVEVLLADAALSPTLWLLLDGLDELPLSDRRRAVGLVEAWPGPAVIATRGLPEQLPPGDVIEVQDLDRYHLGKFLEAEGRADLVPERGHSSLRDVAPEDPLSNLRGELSKTPLGASLIAMVWKGKPASRQALLRDAVLHLVRRAEAEGRLSTPARRRFERQGLRVLGGAAWRMLREGRAILRVEDLDFAERAAGLAPGEGDLLHEAVEHGGFVQPVGPGRWEFSHKSFAELAAAQHLVATRPDHPWVPALQALGDPGANEVLLHVAVLLEEPRPLLDALLRRRDRWLTALRMATRVLVEVAPGAVDGARLLAIVRPRLRIWCALPDQVLPGDLGHLDDVKRAMERHREELAGALDAVLQACPDALRPWVLDPDGEQARLHAARKVRWEAGDYSEPERAVDHVLEDFGRWLHAFYHPPATSISDLLSTPDGCAELRGRPAGEWLGALPPLFGSEAVGKAARDLWWTRARIGDEIRRLGTDPVDRNQRDQFLGLLADRGSPGQRREALLRLCLPQGPGGRSERVLVSGLTDLGADEILALWEPAWRVGALARGPDRRRDGATGLERLYATFLDDDLAPARWRALVALGELHAGEKPKYSSRNEETRGRLLPRPLVHRLTALLSDREPAVAGEALGLLTEAGTRLPWPVLLPLLLGRGPEIRVLAARAALVGRPAFPADLLVHLLAVDFLPPQDDAIRYGQRKQAPDFPWVEALLERVATARAGLEKHLRECLNTWSTARPFFELGDHPSLRPLVDAIASAEPRSYDDRIPQTVLRKALASRHPAARLWALGASGMGRDPLCSEEDLSRLSSDPDAAVADAALERLRYSRPLLRGRVAPEEELDPTPGLGEASGPAALHEGALVAPLGDLFGPSGGATVSVDILCKTKTFEEAWELVGRAGLKTLSWHEVDNAGHGDAVDYLEHFMGQAASHNREVVRGAVEHLATLYTPDWRAALVDALGHPSRGLLAQALLAREPVGRDLLRAIPTHEDAARLVAELAQGTSLALPAVDALVEGLASGALVVGSGEAEWGGYHQPGLIRTLARLGGREGLLRLLVGTNDERLHEHAVRGLLDERPPVEGAVSEGTAAAARRWTLERMEGTQERGRLLRVLSLCGTPSDVAEWRQRADAGAMAADDLVGVATMVGRCGSVDDTPWLRRLALETSHASVVDAAFEALAELGGAENVAWMVDRVDDPPPAIVRARAEAEAREARRNARWKRERALREAARAAGDERWFDIRLDEPEPDGPGLRRLTEWTWSVTKAVVRHGDNAQNIELAIRRHRDGRLLDLGEELGRLPAHALFVMGLIGSDPGERVVPYKLTGGGDEVYGSGHPERARQFVDAVVERTSREGVRLAFLEAMLSGFAGHWGSGESTGLLERLFHRVGGPQPADVSRLVEHLADQPTSAVALEYLGRIGLGESELLAIWRKHDAPWLAPT